MDPVTYPRPDSGPHLGRGPGVYFSAIGKAWELVVKDLGHWIAATLVLFIVAFALKAPVDLLTANWFPARPRFDQMGGYFVALAVRGALYTVPYSITNILSVGMILMGVRKARGEYIDVGMMFEPFRRFGTLFATNLLFLLIAIASTLAGILPSLFIVPTLMLMPTVAYLKGVGPLEALGRTFDACKVHWPGLLALSLALSVILLGGLLACGVGLLLAWPIYCVVLAIHYRAFFEHQMERGL